MVTGRTVTITPRALQLFRDVLLAKNIDDRLRIETDLGLELRLETWEFFFGRNRWPVRYVNDAALRGQLEKIIDTVINRYPPQL